MEKIELIIFIYIERKINSAERWDYWDSHYNICESKMTKLFILFFNLDWIEKSQRIETLSSINNWRSN